MKKAVERNPGSVLMNRHWRLSLGATLAAITIAGSCAGTLFAEGSAGANSLAGQVLNACEADGATVGTAMSAFVAQNPGLVVTATDLVSRAHGGPYIQSWPSNPDFYYFALVHGMLYVIAAGGGPSWTRYVGPESCVRAGVGNPKNWRILNVSSILRSCEADGVTVRVAMEAFVAQNPGVSPTPARLTGKAYGGQYLQSWPHAPGFYSYRIEHGLLYVQGPTNGTPLVRFAGPSSCRVVGL